MPIRTISRNSAEPIINGKLRWESLRGKEVHGK